MQKRNEHAIFFLSVWSTATANTQTSIHDNSEQKGIVGILLREYVQVNSKSELKFHCVKSQLDVVVIHALSERSFHYPRCGISFTLNFIKYTVIEITVISCKGHYIVTYCLSFQTHPDTSSPLICSVLSTSCLAANVHEWLAKHLNPSCVCFKTQPKQEGKKWM